MHVFGGSCQFIEDSRQFRSEGRSAFSASASPLRGRPEERGVVDMERGLLGNPGLLNRPSSTNGRQYGGNRTSSHRSTPIDLGASDEEIVGMLEHRRHVLVAGRPLPNAAALEHLVSERQKEIQKLKREIANSERHKTGQKRCPIPASVWGAHNLAADVMPL